MVQLLFFRRIKRFKTAVNFRKAGRIFFLRLKVYHLFLTAAITFPPTVSTWFTPTHISITLRYGIYRSPTIKLFKAIKESLIKFTTPLLHFVIAKESISSSERITRLVNVRKWVIGYRLFVLKDVSRGFLDIDALALDEQCQTCRGANCLFEVK